MNISIAQVLCYFAPSLVRLTTEQAQLQTQVLGPRHDAVGFPNQAPFALKWGPGGWGPGARVLGQRGKTGEQLGLLTCNQLWKGKAGGLGSKRESWESIALLCLQPCLDQWGQTATIKVDLLRPTQEKGRTLPCHRQ